MDPARTPPVTPGAALRIVFAGAWVLAQAVLIVTASRRADAAFGFRMFAESSTVSAHLQREVPSVSGHGTTLVPVQGGEWIGHDAEGRPRLVRWRDRVIESNLATFDVTMHASYSAAAQVDRWHGALDDVAAHLGEDVETRGLVLDLDVRRNGHEASSYHFTAPRP
jgi:hypothetical protein